MIKKDRQGSESSYIRRENGSQTHHHLQKHLHLINCIHLKQPLHPSGEEREGEMKHHPSTENVVLNTLAALKKSRSLRDPLTSPSWKSNNNMHLILPPSLASLPKIRADWEGPKTRPEKASSVEQRNRILLGGGAHQDLSENEEWLEIRPGKSTPSEDDTHVQDSAMRAFAKRNWQREGGGSYYPPSYTVNCQNAVIETNKLIRVPNSQPEYNYNDRNTTTTATTTSRTTTTATTTETGSPEEEKKNLTFRSSSNLPHLVIEFPKSNRKGRRRGRKSRRTLLKVPAKRREDCMEVPSSSHPKRATIALVEPTESEELQISELPHNRCGMPWNWSRIHSRGKNFLDMAGRSLSCASSEPPSKRLGLVSGATSCGSYSTTGSTSDHTNSMFMSESESLPLLFPNPVSMTESENNQDRRRKSPVLLNPKRQQNIAEDMHKSFSQKYSPESFRQILGQPLVTQALSNALDRPKIAPVYLFSGPHGTGKTSCARVFGMALNCSSIHTQKPCGSCKECFSHKTSFVKEFSAAGKHCLKAIKRLLCDIAWMSTPHYKVFILEECHALSLGGWNTFMKILDKVPKNVVFILLTSNPGELPHAVLSKCQKFLFTKIKEGDIVKRLMEIAEQEGMDVDQEALKLVANRSEGSLRDAEVMLDQLSLLGHKISPSMVQELVGLIPDEKLVALLDCALSADTVHTVRRIRDLTDSGVDPLMLMSQLATLITKILAGNYKLPKDGQRRFFFHRNHLTKGDTERLRQALKTLSESEKQMRGSTDRMTWLTAALLQFAPDQSYLLSNSSTDTSVSQSPAGLYYSNSTDMVSALKNTLVDNLDELKESLIEEKPKSSDPNTALPSNNINQNESSARIRSMNEIEDIWQRILSSVHSNNLRQFLQSQGKLLSVSVCKASSVAHLELRDSNSLARAEKSRKSIGNALYLTFGCQVDTLLTLAKPWPHEEEDSMGRKSLSRDRSRATERGSEESCDQKSLEVLLSEREKRMGKKSDEKSYSSEEKLENAWVQNMQEYSPHSHRYHDGYRQEELDDEEEPRSTNSLEKSKLSLVGLVVQKAEGDGKDLQFEDVNIASCGMHAKQIIKPEGISGQGSYSIAAKLEEQNLHLESKSGGVLCWKSSNSGEGRTSWCPKKNSLLSRFVPCGKSSSSP